MGSAREQADGLPRGWQILPDGSDFFGLHESGLATPPRMSVSLLVPTIRRLDGCRLDGEFDFMPINPGDSVTLSGTVYSVFGVRIGRDGLTLICRTPDAASTARPVVLEPVREIARRFFIDNEEIEIQPGLLSLSNPAESEMMKAKQKSELKQVVSGLPGTLANVRVDAIDPSPDQPRRHFDEAKLRELADSMKVNGLRQPIGIRPVEDSDRFTLVFGERRLRAAKLLKWEYLPAIVSTNLTAEQAAELTMLENLQREDLTEIEEAHGYQFLLKKCNYTADDLAEKLGKSKSYVYGRLKLCVELPAEVLEAAEDGAISASVLQLIGRLPSLSMRQRFYEEYLKHRLLLRQRITVEGVENLIAQHWTRELKGAPFSQSDAKLLPDAGSCKLCPKRTGNNRGDYPEGRADICTDTACFEQKIKATLLRYAATNGYLKAKALDEKDRQYLFNAVANNLTWKGEKEYVLIQSVCREDRRKRTYAEIAGEVISPVVTLDGNNEPALLFPRKAIEKLLTDQKILKSKPAPEKAAKGETLKSREDDRKVRAQVIPDLIRQVGEAAAERLKKPGATDAVNILRRIAARQLAECGYEFGREVCLSLGLEDPGKNDQAIAPLVAEINQRNATGLLELLARFEAAHELEDWRFNGDLEEGVCTDFGINPDEFLKARQKEKDAADSGGTPTRTICTQEELQAMGKVNAAQAISENTSVKLYYHDGNPLVITGGCSRNHEYEYVNGWSVLPLNIASDAPEGKVNPKTSYLNVRIKVGKETWVIVGPEHRFTAR